MSRRILILASGAALVGAALAGVAGCDSSAVQGAGGAGPGTITAASPAAASPATAATSAPPGTTPTAAPTAPVQASPACGGSGGATLGAGVLTATQFVSATQGWAVGQNAILATTDGGAHWTTQLSGPLNLTSVDFVNGQDGWAVGTTGLLATTDGGAVWTALAEPCPVIRSVHFISPAAGYAVAGGSDVAGTDPEVPGAGGEVLATVDGGHSWHALPAPPDAQTVCFSDPQHGWLGASGQLYRTSDGGQRWTVLTSSAGSLGGGQGALMSVECAGPGSAWALRTGPGAAMSQQPHVGYHADQSGATALFAELYFQTPGATPTAPAPGSYAGPFSALSPSAAVFIDNCAACGAGTAPWDLVTNSGATLAKEGNVGDITDAEAASFVSAEVGWVAGTEMTFQAAGTRSQQRIVATTDGGRSWHIQYAGAWTTSS
jgi:hypothetical protein